MGSLTRRKNTNVRMEQKQWRICRLPKRKLSTLLTSRPNLNKPLMSSMTLWLVKRGLELTLKSKEGRLREISESLKKLLLIMKGKRRNLKEQLEEKKKTLVLLLANWMMSNLWLLKSKSLSKKSKEELRWKKNLKQKDRLELRLKGKDLILLESLKVWEKGLMRLVVPPLLKLN